MAELLCIDWLRGRAVKNNIHPNYRKVVFHDTSVDKYFVIGSTLETDRTIEWEDGKNLPVYDDRSFFRISPLLHR